MNKLFPILLIMLSIFSCTIYREFPIEVYQPGQVSLPVEIKNIALINRNFKYNNDTLQHYYKSSYILKKDKKNIGLNIDSISASNVLQGLANELTNNGSFENISIFPYDLIKPHRGEKIHPFKWGFVNELAGSSSADLVISLETFSYFYSEYKFPEFDNPGREVVTVAVWGIYAPGSEKLLDRKSMVDTVFWTEAKEKEYKDLKLPDRLAAIKMASIVAGENYAKRLIPSWQTVNRMFVIPPVEDFRLAAAYLTNSEWEKAIPLWEKYTQKKYGKLAINAQYNLALAYEMKDDLDKALDWAKLAHQLAISYKSKEDIKMTLLYLKVLLKRQNEMNVLKSAG